MAVDVERGEQGHELLFISAPEAEQQFIKNMQEGGKRKQTHTQNQTITGMEEAESVRQIDKWER